MTMPSNPFATRYFQPGAIRYEFFGQVTIDDLCQRILTVPSKRALIVGPHGSGKSTLIATLIEHFETSYPAQAIHSIRFSTDPSSRTQLPNFLRSLSRNSLAIIDGYEQLGMWSRWRLLSSLRQKSIRLLATAHQKIAGMDQVWETKVDEASSKWVIEKLLSNGMVSDESASDGAVNKGAASKGIESVGVSSEGEEEGHNPKQAETAKRLFESEEWRSSRTKHGPNLRESLFDMYDWWQKNET